MKSIKHIRNGILVECKHSKQFNLLSQIQDIDNIPVKIQERSNYTKGVISGVPVDISEEEILEALQNQKVKQATRMTKKNKEQGDQKIPLKTVILSFETNKLPEDVQIWYQNFQVKPYIPPIKRCFNCQRLRHTANACQAKQRCVRCGGPHAFKDCDRKDKPVCVRCNEQHSAAYKGCNVVKRAQEVQKIKVTGNLTYAQAVHKFKKTNEVKTSTIPPLPTAKSKKTDHPNINPQEVPLEGNPWRSSQPKAAPSVKKNTPHPPSSDPRNTPMVSNQSSASTFSTPLHTLKEKNENPLTNFLTHAKDEEILKFIITVLDSYSQKLTKEEFLNTLILISKTMFTNFSILDKQQTHHDEVDGL